MITEGKTDWKHLKRSLNKLRAVEKIDDNFLFLEYEDEIEMGSSNLLTICRSISKLENNSKIIAVFDRDEKTTISQASHEGNFKRWGNNVYSFVLPIPPHRSVTPNISIEHYYLDDEIKLEDKESRRLYLGNEFTEKFGISVDHHKVCKYKNKCGVNSIQIIDDGISLINEQNNNIALSKSAFAQYIIDDMEPFNKVSFNEFLIIFKIIGEIISDS